ncbi:DUF6551 family protein [Pelagibacterium mangrovi]|uniref:DUF6551 family protein n=1 Tax=Pelagibacterium mangrovi TaxID=3119828 RepID=UPI002FC6AA43
MEDEPTFRDPGPLPDLDWIDVSLIDVDPTYQRGLDDNRVTKILDWFSWRSFGALTLAKAEDGRYHAIDGQHRLEAAKRHPSVTLVPCTIIEADGTVAEAETFVTVNANRKNVSPLEMYWAELAADDPEALTVAQVTNRAGVEILRYPGSNGNYKPGQTVAIAALRTLIDKRGAMRARQILEVLAKAELHPITGLQIKACEALMLDPEYCVQIEPDAIADAIRGHALMLDDEAAAFAATHRLPKWKAMVSVWFRRTRKKRKAA